MRAARSSRVWFFVPQAASRLAALVSFAVIANHVRPDDLGVFALISAVASGAIALGPAIVAKPLAAAADREERERLATLAVSAAIAVAVAGFLVLSVASLVTHGLVRLTLAGAGLATLGVLTVEATYWAFVFTRGARGVGLVVAGAYALQAGATLVAAHFTDRAGLVLVPPAALALAGVLAIGLQRPTLRAASAWYRDYRADWLPYVGGSAAGIASVQAIPLIVTGTVGLTGASVFRALELAFGPTNLSATVTSNSLLAHSGDSRAETRRLYRRANIELGLVAVVNGLLLWRLPPGVVRPLLGHATATLQAHAVAGSAFRVAYTVSLVGVILLVSRYTARTVGVINVVSVVVTLLALTVGLVVGGIRGGFVALAITEAAQVTLSYVLLRRADR
jgi:hypothetical protein